jgi:TPR repeat protein
MDEARIKKRVAGLKAAATRGFPGSMYSVGLSYYMGSYGFEKNEVLGLAWMKKAGEEGHAGACHYLGEIYALKNGLSGYHFIWTADDIESFYWYEKAYQIGCDFRFPKWFMEARQNTRVGRLGDKFIINQGLRDGY